MGTVRVYKSGNTGAPPHPSDVRGSMAALLRACLVAGYGVAAIDSLVVSAGVATLTISGGVTWVTGQVIALTGAAPSALNAEWRLASVTTTTATFNVPGLADCTATGTITATLPPAGWEEPFEESGNVAAFRALQGAKQFLQIDDATSTDADVTLMSCWESMSDVFTGIGNWRGGTSNNFFGKWYDATYSTEWWLIADERTFYVFLSSRYGLIIHGFGEFTSIVEDDPYNSFVAGHSYPSALPATSSGSRHVDMEYMGAAMGSGATTPNGCFRVHKTLSGVPNWATLMSPYGRAGTVGGSIFPLWNAFPGMNYPAVPIWFFCNSTVEGVSNGVIRGTIRGLYCPCAFRPRVHGDIFTLGERLWLPLSICSGNNDGYRGQVWLDITGSWD